MGYNRVIPRHKLDIFVSDIDVYTESGSREIMQLYCECKFRVYDQELTETDLDQLIEKIKIIENNKKRECLQNTGSLLIPVKYRNP